MRIGRVIDDFADLLYDEAVVIGLKVVLADNQIHFTAKEGKFIHIVVADNDDSCVGDVVFEEEVDLCE